MSSPPTASPTPRRARRVCPALALALALSSPLVSPAHAQSGPDAPPEDERIADDLAADPSAGDIERDGFADPAGDPATADGALDDDEFVEILGPEPGFLPEPELEQYVSVSTKITQTVEDTPASVYVIDRDQIERAGYRSVGEALTFAPGLYVSYDLVNYHVGVRGIFGGSRSGSRTLKVMVNGQAVEYVQSGTYFLGPEFIPISAVERIEIMRGPASSLYGTGALEGAINVVTRRPPYEGDVTVGGKFNVYGGSPGKIGGGGDGTVTVTGERFFALLAASAGYDDRSGLRLPEDSYFYDDPRFVDPTTGAPMRSADDIARPVSLFTQVETRVFDGRLQARALGQFHDRKAEFHDLTVFSRDTRINLYNVNVGVSYEKPFASGYAIRARVGSTRAGPRDGDQIFIGATTPVGIEEGRNLLYTRRFSSTEGTASLELLRELGERGLALVGVDGAYQREDIQQITVTDPMTGDATLGEDPPARSLFNSAVFTQVLYPLNDAVTLAGGVRLDYSNVYDAVLTGRVASVIKPMERLSLKLMAGRAYKAPSAEQLYGSPLTNGDFEGADNLPEQYINGFEATVNYFLSRSLKLSLTGFYNLHKDALSNLLRGGRLVATSFDSTTIGGEFIAQYARALTPGVQLDLSAHGSVQDTRTPTQVVIGITEKPVPDNEIYPRVMATLLANAHMPAARLNANLAYRYVGRRIPSQSNLLAAGTVIQDDPAYVLPWYHVIDLALSTMPMKVESVGELIASVKVENLLDERYAEIGFNGVDVPNLGRVLWLRANMEF
ncbi:TonB-dependent receptor plug domain-containing protein [Haliangium ochraceum]|uniref:TonB-dependent receptor n=1 Tax=Haliangium ochraceum (strain DSM 14365 / JCM 11303 / SMP-2) TaxID=502025 RepID=D0LLT2_HALO1|nr:TonB-dependent receptor [Haliangium ochraceum]ACY15110.1 TonB-dependent receptor [Haliangium ochraceum DSM 14365]